MIVLASLNEQNVLLTTSQIYIDSRGMYVQGEVSTMKFKYWLGVANQGKLLSLQDMIVLASLNKQNLVMRNYDMNRNFADINLEGDFQPFNDENNSHLQTKIS